MIKSPILQDSQSTSFPITQTAEQVSHFPTCLATVCWGPSGTRLTKAFDVDAQGNLHKVSAPMLTQGIAQTVQLPLDQILLLSDEQNQCVSLGVLKEAEIGETVPFTTRARLESERKHDPRTVTRTKEHLFFPANQAIYAFIDHDPDESTIPAVKPRTLSELLLLIKEVWPESGFDQAAWIFTPSASAGVRLEADPARTSELEYAGAGHIGVAFAAGVDPTAWMRTLYAKFIEAGHASAYVTKHGRLEVRTLIDRSVAQPCRVEYTAPAVLGNGVARDNLQRPDDCWQQPGGYINVAPDSLYSEDQVRRVVDAERKTLAEVPAVQARIQTALSLAREEAEIRYRAAGTAPDDAERRAQEWIQRISSGDEKITISASDPLDIVFGEQGAVPVGEIFADMQEGGDRFNGQHCADPESGKPGKGMVYYQQDQQRVWIHSFDGGGRNYAIVAANSVAEGRKRAVLSTDPQLNEKFYELAGLPGADFDRARKQIAAELGLSVAVLKKSVDDARKELVREAQTINLPSLPLVGGSSDWADTDGPLSGVVRMLQNGTEIGCKIAYDTFYGNEMISPIGQEGWRPVEEADLMELRLRLESLGIDDVGREKIRDALGYVAARNPIDAAQKWAEGLPEWDGVERVRHFYPNYLSTKAGDYAEALGFYTWTALAGRLLSPGCKADMVPTWIGEQGARKTTAVMSMVPSPEHYAEVSFAEDETELARKQRGKLVLEIAELAGYNKKERESQKAWITRLYEEWTPKFKERTVRFPRRAICIATANNGEFLQDPTGNRRWLPINVGTVDVDLIRKDREQLWAEAINLYGCNGIMWLAAEREARKIISDHEVENPYLEIIREWLNTPVYKQKGFHGEMKFKDPSFVTHDCPCNAAFLTLREVACFAMEVKATDITRHQTRIAEALRKLGYECVERRHNKGEGPFKAWVPRDIPTSGHESVAHSVATVAHSGQDRATPAALMQ